MLRGGVFARTAAILLDIACRACYNLSNYCKGGANMTKQETYDYLTAHGIASEVLPLLHHAQGLLNNAAAF